MDLKSNTPQIKSFNTFPLSKNLSKVQKILKDNSVHYDEIGLVTEKDIILDKEPIIHIDDLVKSNTNWLKEYMDK
mgnify:CR=1 FL=1